MSARKSILCVDFDGVIHSYAKSGWQGADKANDPPVPGALEFLREAIDHFRVNVYSSRSSQPGGIDCMKRYVLNYALNLSDDVSWIGHLEYPTDKPAAMFTIDDRAFMFNGVWPTMDFIKEFQPWNKRDKEYPVTIDGYVQPARLILPMTSEQLFTAVSTQMCNKYAGIEAVSMQSILEVSQEITRKFFPNI